MDAHTSFQPDTSIDQRQFLLSHRPVGLQNLVAIGPNGEAPSGATFDMPGEIDQALEWANDRNRSGQNLYFSVNPVKRRIAKKATKDDIACVDYAHLDLDPDWTLGYEKGRQKLLGEPLARLATTATSVVDSGNGLGAFWRLLEPQNIKEGEEINARLIALYGGDTGTGNADRLMRLPGTLNHAGKSKQAKGYPMQTTAKVLHVSGRLMTAEVVRSLPPVPVKAAIAADCDAGPDYCHLGDTDAAAALCRLHETLDKDPALRSRWQGDLLGLRDRSRSGYDMSLMAMLKSRGFTYSEAVSLLVDADLEHSGAADHFAEDNMRYFQRCWLRSFSDQAPSAPLVEASNPLDWTSNFTVSDEEVAAMHDPEWVIENLVVKGHMIMICAEPNGGKTTIFMHYAGEMVKAGMRVFYVNADVSGGDAKRYHQQAKEAGFELLLPDMKVGLSMSDVVARLELMNNLPGDYSNVVFIFDTLKKMTDVINKNKAKELLKMLRCLTAKGMTIICLAHTNKYKGEDGRPVFEGTGDVRADCDELIYLIPDKQSDGSILVSTDPDKKRCDMEKMTLVIHPDRSVSRKELYIDTLEARRCNQQRAKDQEHIEVIREAISEGNITVRAINAYCKEAGMGGRTTDKVRKAYKGVEWDSMPGFSNNRLEFFLLERDDEWGTPS